jgi:hypothetical protein
MARRVDEPIDVRVVGDRMVSDQGSAARGSAARGSAAQGGTDQSSTDQASADQGSADQSGADQNCAPMSFLWRGRLYVVREVLGHWRDRREWWTTAAARALHGDEWDRPQGAPLELDHEREVWRVEASPGRSFSAGVYDLSREPVAGRPAAADATEVWRLLQVAD